MSRAERENLSSESDAAQLGTKAAELILNSVFELYLCLCTVGQTQVVLRHLSLSHEQGSEWASKWTSECSGVREQSEQFGLGNKWKSERSQQFSEWTSEWPSTYIILVILDHSACLWAEHQLGLWVKLQLVSVSKVNLSSANTTLTVRDTTFIWSVGWFVCCLNGRSIDLAKLKATAMGNWCWIIDRFVCGQMDFDVNFVFQ